LLEQYLEFGEFFVFSKKLKKIQKEKYKNKEMNVRVNIGPF
jgi:hypothetical protein